MSSVYILVLLYSLNGNVLSTEKTFSSAHAFLDCIAQIKQIKINLSRLKGFVVSAECVRNENKQKKS